MSYPVKCHIQSFVISSHMSENCQMWQVSQETSFFWLLTIWIYCLLSNVNLRKVCCHLFNVHASRLCHVFCFFVWCFMSVVFCLMVHAWCLISGVLCLVYFVSGVLCVIQYVSCLLTVVLCLLSGCLCPVYGCYFILVVLCICCPLFSVFCQYYHLQVLSYFVLCPFYHVLCLVYIIRQLFLIQCPWSYVRFL